LNGVISDSVALAGLAAPGAPEIFDPENKPKAIDGGGEGLLTKPIDISCCGEI
jgi:hypothetical protein